jgi:hypothetical protein
VIPNQQLPGTAPTNTHPNNPTIQTVPVVHVIHPRNISSKPIPTAESVSNGTQIQIQPRDLLLS